MVTLKWDEIDPCATCFALVPRQVMHLHTDWHDNIAREAIRSAGRLDRLEQGGAVIRVWVDGPTLVMRCACGHEDACQQRPASLVRALVLRIADHTRNCRHDCMAAYLGGNSRT
jgi:hypothetical protein